MINETTRRVENVARTLASTDHAKGFLAGIEPWTRDGDGKVY